MLGEPSATGTFKTSASVAESYRKQTEDSRFQILRPVRYLRQGTSVLRSFSGKTVFRPGYRIMFEHARAWARESSSAPVAATAFVAFAVVFFQWFTTGAFYATGDITPWVRTGLASDLGWQWTHQLSGAGGPSYEIVRAPEVFFNAIARIVGGEETLGQRLLFSVMFAFAAAGGASLVGVFAQRRLTVVVGGLATAFNVWFLLYLPNYLPVVTVGILASITSLALRVARGERRRPILFAFMLVPLSYVSMNPPLVLVITVWGVLLPLTAAALTGTGRAGFGRVVGLLARASVLVIPLSIWWVVPMGVALTQSVGSDSIGAVTDVVAWSWTHRRNSIPNVLTLHSEWSWPLSQYHGAAIDLANAPFAWLDWVFPAGVVLAPIVTPKSRRRPFLIIGMLLPVLVLLGKGLHEPFGSINLGLYRTVPGLWLLREPMSKLGPIFVMSYVVAWSVSLEQLARRLNPLRMALTGRQSFPLVPFAQRRNQVVLAGGTALLLLAPAVNAWPMWTGSATSDVQPGRTERVKLPEAWRAIAANLNSSPLRGKALVLPLGDFYQMPTTWGYYGADNLVRQLLTRPVISRNPEGYITDTPTFDLLAQSAETAIAAGEADKSVSLLRALGVSHVVVRKDFDLATPQRAITGVRNFQPIIAGLSSVPTLETAIDNGVARVFTLQDKRAEPVQLLNGVLSTGRIADDALVPLLTSIPAGQALADDGKMLTVGPAWSSAVGLPIQKFSVAQEATFEVGRRTRSVPTYVASVTSASRSSKAFLQLRELATFRLGNKALPARPDIRIPLPSGSVRAIEVGTDIKDLRTSNAFVSLDSATNVNVLADAGNMLGEFGVVEDCNAYDPRTKAQAGLKALVTNASPPVELQALAHSACVSAPLSPAVGGQVVEVVASSRTVIGHQARLCLLAVGPDECVDLPEPTTENGWTTTDALVRLPPKTTAARLYLYADASNVGSRGDQKDNPRRTLTQYRQIQVRRLIPIASKTVGASPPAAATIQLPAGSHDLLTTFNLPTPKIAGWGGVEDCNQIDGRSKPEVGIEAERLGGSDQQTTDLGVVLRARAHAACVSSPVHAMVGRASYELRLSYRTLHGTTPPRVCLLDPSTNRCAALRPLRGTLRQLRSSAKWATVRYAVSIPNLDQSGRPPRIYIYGDTTAGRTELAYTNVALKPIADESVTVVATGKSSFELPSFSWIQENPASYNIAVKKVSNPFVLALSDSWSPDWKVRGLPKGSTVTQLRIDGYRNGWLIDARGDLDLTVEYTPARWGRLAISVSVSAASVAALFTSVVMIRRRRRLHGLRHVFRPRGLRITATRDREIERAHHREDGQQPRQWFRHRRSPTNGRALLRPGPRTHARPEQRNRGPLIRAGRAPHRLRVE
jgi:arabinofuranan 3-O-arabinosyltransferase